MRAFVNNSVSQPIFSRDGQMLAYTNATFRLQIEKLRDGKLEDVTLPDDTRTQLVSLVRSSVVATQGGAFSPDGTLLALIRAQGTLFKLWKTDVVILDTRTWKIVRAIPARARELTSVAFSSDGNRLAAGSADGGATVYRVATGQTMTTWNPRNGFKSAVVSFSQTPKGEHALVLTVGQTPTPSSTGRSWSDAPDFSEVWDVETGQKLAEFSEMMSVRAGAFSWDGQSVALVGEVQNKAPDSPIRPTLLFARWNVVPSPESRRLVALDSVGGLGLPVWMPADREIFLSGFFGDAESLRVFAAKSQTSTP